MDFEKTLISVKNVIKNDLNSLEHEIQVLCEGDNPLNDDLRTFLTAPAKRLRPILGFLFLRSVFENIDENQRNIMLAVELIHNATLIHDDIIDNADERRHQKTLNSKFDNNLAVVAGDYLLSVAMEKIIKTDSIKVLRTFTDALKSTCIGEINQYFTKYQVPTIEQYIEKSKEKTARLFEIGILSGILLSDKKSDKKLLDMASEFSQNFGIAFQIRNDLTNYIKSGSDLKSGIYTAPVIFAVAENPDILKNKIESINETKAIEKTKNLMDNYFNKAILAIGNIKESKYKTAIIELIESLRKN
jgi:geranylgeranyl pyrophosphate synthase